MVQRRIRHLLFLPRDESTLDKVTGGLPSSEYSSRLSLPLEYKSGRAEVLIHDSPRSTWSMESIGRFRLLQSRSRRPGETWRAVRRLKIPWKDLPLTSSCKERWERADICRTSVLL